MALPNPNLRYGQQDNHSEADRRIKESPCFPSSISSESPHLTLDDKSFVESRTHVQCISRRYMICLTIGSGGLQVVWTAIFGHGSAYLSSLGLSPHIISFIWLAGPLSGAVFQPYVSVLSDRSQHPSGKRRPFILVGTIFTIFFMLLLPWTGEMIQTLSGQWDHESNMTPTFIARGVLASVLIWGLNVSIQPIQMGLRALICEACPFSQMAQATAYSSIIAGIGNVLGYAAGFIDLPLYMPWVGDTQFKCVSVIASVWLALTIIITLVVIEEANCVGHDASKNRRPGLPEVLEQIWSCAASMPKNAKTICRAQFFAWLGWSPFLLYVTPYLAGLYQKSSNAEVSNDPSNRYHLPLSPDAIRFGTSAMVSFAVIALSSNILLPFIVSSNHEPSFPSETQPPTRSDSTDRIRSQMPFERSPRHKRLRGLANSQGRKFHLRIPAMKVNLIQAWTASHITTSAALFLTLLTRSPRVSTVLVSILGISWALTQWIPLALMTTLTKTAPSDEIRSKGRSDEMIRSPTFSNEAADEEPEGALEAGGKLPAGTIMGVFNMAIAVPQIVAAVVGSFIFWLLQSYRLEDVNAFGWIIRLGGFASIAAAWYTAGIRSENSEKGNMV